MPTLNIKDEEVYRLARELADEHNSTMTAEVLRALQERKERTRQSGHGNREGLGRKIMALSRRAGTRYQGEDRTRDLFDDLYDEYGLPK